MNDKYKEITIKLTNKLEREFLGYTLDAFSDEEEINISDILNVIMSVHLSSMFTIMILVSQDKDHILKEVHKFIQNIRKFIASQPVISKIEDLYQTR